MLLLLMVLLMLLLILLFLILFLLQNLLQNLSCQCLILRSDADAVHLAVYSAILSEIPVVEACAAAKNALLDIIGTCVNLAKASILQRCLHRGPLCPVALFLVDLDLL